LDYELEAQPINHLSNVDELCPAAYDDNLDYIQIRRQWQIVESINILEDETICLDSETNPQSPIEEVKAAFGLDTFYRLREIISISPILYSENNLLSINVV
jgi:hypothetical protein